MAKGSHETPPEQSQSILNTQKHTHTHIHTHTIIESLTGHTQKDSEKVIHFECTSSTTGE